MEKLLRRVRGKETVTMADPSCSVLDLTSIVADDDHLDLNVDDLVSTWEIIDPSDEDQYEDDFSLDDTHDHENDEFQDLGVDVDVVVDLDLDVDGGLGLGLGLGFSISHLSSTQFLGEKPITSYPVDVRCDSVNDQSISERYEEEEKEEDDDGYDYDYDYEYDLDDELVPKSVGDRFGRERLRKRACPRMNKSKKLAHHYNRPGCVHGKHGLGVKHILI